MPEPRTVLSGGWPAVRMARGSPGGPPAPGPCRPREVPLCRCCRSPPPPPARRSRSSSAPRLPPCCKTPHSCVIDGAVCLYPPVCGRAPPRTRNHELQRHSTQQQNSTTPKSHQRSAEQLQNIGYWTTDNQQTQATPIH